MSIEFDIINAVFGGFVSKIINDGVDKTKPLFTSSSINMDINSQFYAIIIGALNSITYNKYKNSEILLNVADEILKSILKHGTNNFNAVRNSLRNITTLTEETYKDFKMAICKELSKNENQELFNTISIMIGLDTNAQIIASTETLNLINYKIDLVLSFLAENKKVFIDDDSIKLFKNNKKRLYLDKWFSPLFLHVYDENPLLLKDAFIMPDYTMSTSINIMHNLKDSNLESVIDKVINYSKTTSLVITGVPGIGKTTITSWIANKYILNNNLIILRFRDWSVDELSNGFLKAIQNTLSCNLENMILVLDGFDENKALNRCDELLSDFLCDIKDFNNLKVIITSRPTYFSNDNDFENFIQLLPFDQERIQLLYYKITKQKLNIKIPNSSCNVYGIPVILYMVIMSNIDISLSSTAFELYNKIFSKKGGILDRFSNNGTEYDDGSHALRNQKNIAKYLNFLEEISFIMFKRNKLTLAKDEYELPTIDFNGKTTILDFPLKFLFDDNNNSIEFIHKTIYEYFLSEYIYNNIKCLDGKSNQQIAGIFGRLFNMNLLPEEVIDNLKSKISHDKNLLTENKKISNVFNLMLEDGMTYHTRVCYKNVMKCEKNVFINMLNIIHLWDFKNYILINGYINKYLESNWMLNINLINLDLIGVDFSNTNLEYANFTNANLTDAEFNQANLTDANFTNAKLIRTNLSYAHLIYAKLTHANLIEAKLVRAVLIKADLINADLSGADLSGANLFEANLSKANLSEADLIEANLSKANLSEANLIDANLIGANLSEANLIKTMFNENSISSIIDKCDLSNALIYSDRLKNIITYNEFIESIPKEYLCRESLI